MIELAGVSKAFGKHQVLTGLSLKVEAGETLVMLGRSGTGKSVTLKIVDGLLAPDSGTVRVADVDVLHANPEALRSLHRRVAFLFQTGALINWLTVHENVALPLVEQRELPQREIDAKVSAALESLDMLASAEQFPDRISGGMRKRAALARVLVQQPDVVLYDEPTAGLDPILSRTVGKLINKVQSNDHRAALVVTHDLELAFAVADRIGLHHKGQLVEVGTPDVFRKSPHPVVRAFLDGKDELPEGE